VAALVVGVALGLGYAHIQGVAAAVAGHAIGSLTGRTTALPASLEASGAGRGSSGHDGSHRGDHGGSGDGPAVLTAGPDGVIGNTDDVLLPAHPGRSGGPSSGDDDTTTTTTGRSTDSTSTTVPPIPSDLAIGSITVPATAADSTDGCGAAVGFDAARLDDHQPGTAWRMDGDGSGQSLTLPLGGSHHVVSVGLIPGYAQVDACDGTDRFAQNRRITQVTWQFDDGTTVVQPLSAVAEMQMVAVNAQASTVTLHIDGVTADPERDFTAISELNVRGT
jgi:hypothetical protein